METVLENDNAEKVKSLSGFFKAVFNTSRESQSMVVNATQFATLALLPAYGLLRMLREYVPHPDDAKGSMEIIAEVIGQTVAMVVGIVLIDRAVTYIPTMSGTPYADTTNIIPGILIPFIIILLTVQTKLGTKIDILYDRVSGDSQPNRQEGMENPEEKERAHGLLPSYESTGMPQIALSDHLPPLTSTHAPQSPPGHAAAPDSSMATVPEPEPFSF